jgi:CheY-like chemotaxis protein
MATESGTILLVEDEAFVREVTREVLESAGVPSTCRSKRRRGDSRSRGRLQCRPADYRCSIAG